MFYLNDVEFVINYERENRTGYKKKLHAECVVIAVVCRLEFHVHQVDRAERWGEIEDFHERVVQRDEMGEQVKVACGEHDRKQYLTLARYT